MSEDFERKLKTLFAEVGEGPSDDAFQVRVMGRVTRLRRVAQILSAAAAAAAFLAMAALTMAALTPFAVSGTALVVESLSASNGALGAFLVSPLGYVLGAVAALAAFLRFHAE